MIRAQNGEDVQLDGKRLVKMIVTKPRSMLLQVQEKGWNGDIEEAISKTDSIASFTSKIMSFALQVSAVPEAV